MQYKYAFRYLIVMSIVLCMASLASSLYVGECWNYVNGTFCVNGTTSQLQLTGARLNWSYLDNTPAGFVDTDTNNYTSSISYTGNILSLARIGMSTLTASIPNNAITSSILNITGTDSNQCSSTDKVTNVSFVNGALTILCDTDQTGGGGDGNNYPTSLTFSSAVLTMGRNGLGDLTATLPNYTILLDAQYNLTNKIGLQNSTLLSCSNITGATSNLCTIVPGTGGGSTWGRNDTDIINQTDNLAFNWTTLNNKFWSYANAVIQNTSIWTAINLRTLQTDFVTQNTSYFSIFTKQSDFVVQNTSTWNSINLRTLQTDLVIQNTSNFAIFTKQSDLVVQNTSNFAIFTKQADLVVQNTSNFAIFTKQSDLVVQNTSNFAIFAKQADMVTQNTSTQTAINLKLSLADFQTQNATIVKQGDQNRTFVSCSNITGATSNLCTITSGGGSGGGNVTLNANAGYIPLVQNASQLNNSVILQQGTQINISGNVTVGSGTVYYNFVTNSTDALAQIVGELNLTSISVATAVLCKKADGNIGECSSVVGVTGLCTCG